MKTEIIKIDTAFKWRNDDRLKSLIESWANIIDKTVLKERWIQYIIATASDPDLGKTKLSNNQ